MEIRISQSIITNSASNPMWGLISLNFMIDTRHRSFEKYTRSISVEDVNNLYKALNLGESKIKLGH